MQVEFTGAQLLKGSDISLDYIQHWHNGRSFFEFVPEESVEYSLRIYRDFAENRQSSKDFKLSNYLKMDRSLSINMRSVKAMERSD